jgi:hypothetical protein
MVPLWNHETYGDVPPVTGWTIGWRAIELIEEGDWVVSRDEHDPHGAMVPKQVEEKFRRWGMSAKMRAWGKEIGTTREHPFFVVDQETWTPAKDLQAGNRFLSHDGQEPAFEGLEETGNYEELYNLRVADFHTYFVGGEDWGFSVWAHNSCTLGAYEDVGGHHVFSKRAFEGVTPTQRWTGNLLNPFS